MFQWDETIRKLDVGAAETLKFFRSMRDVQLALPGLPSQEASAYLCQYQVGKLVATIAVFHLHMSSQLAFYCSDPREVSSQKAAGILDQGLNFVESMGFLLSDMDIELMDESDREILWESLPLRKGMTPEGGQPVKVPVASDTVVSQRTEKKVVPRKVAAKVDAPEKVLSPGVKASASRKTIRRSEVAQVTVEPKDVPAVQAVEATEDVDELLAAVEGLRAKRPGLAPRKKRPTPDEIKTRRKKLSENLGRILVSL